MKHNYAIIFWRDGQPADTKPYIWLHNGLMETFETIEEADSKANDIESNHVAECRVISLDSVHI